MGHVFNQLSAFLACISADSTRNNRRKRSVDETSSEKTIETLLVLDQKMTQYYGLDFSKQHALYLSNIVSFLMLSEVYCLIILFLTILVSN